MSPSPIRVAILYDRPLKLGGVETHLRSLVRCADPAQFRFLLIAPGAEAFSSQIEAGLVEFVPFNGWWPIRCRDIRVLRRIVTERGVHLVHPHSPTAAIIGRAVARWRKLPVVVTVHLPVTQYHGTDQTWRARIGRSIFTGLDRLLNHRATDQIIFVSQSTRDDCTASGLAPDAKSVVIHNGIDLSEYRVRKDKNLLRQQLGAPEEADIISFVGRLDQQKGIVPLISAFAALDATTKPVLLWMIGDGPLRDEIASSVEAHHLQGRVVLWGYQPKVADFLFASDLFVLPSLYEAMPITLIEALAAGLPCIATNVGDNALIIQDGVNGLIVPPDDPPALQNALRVILNDPGLREKMRDQNLANMNHYDEHRMVQALQSIYHRWTVER